jgi:hypothetical protein
MPIVLAVIMDSTTMPLPPIPSFLFLTLARIIMFFVPGNAHGQEELFEFALFWLLAMVATGILFVLWLCCRALIKKRI